MKPRPPQVEPRARGKAAQLAPACLLCFGVFAVLFVKYAFGACRTVAAGDSGILLAAMSRWGVPHAPGYPLLSLLGNLVALLPGPGEVAFRLNLLNAAFAAAACAVLALAVRAATQRPLAGAVVALSLGLTPTFWQLALAVEVFGLNSLFAALLLLFFAHFLRGWRTGHPPLWPLPASAGVAAAVLTHHTTLVLLVAPLALVYAVMLGLLVRRGLHARWLQRALLASAAALVLGLLPLLYLPLAARGDPPLNWGDARDLPSLVHLLLRGDFGTGTLVAPDIAAQSVLDHGVSASPLGLRHFRHFVTGYPDRAGWVLVALTVLGGIVALQGGWELPALLLGFAGAVLLFFTRVNTPWVPLFIGITERLFVLPDLVLAVVAGLGLARVMDASARRWRFAPAVLAVLVLLAGAPLRIASGGAAMNESGNTFTRELGENLLSGLPNSAILFTDGDLFRNSVLYQQACLGARPDVAAVDGRMLTLPWYVRQLRRRHALELPAGMERYSGAPGADMRAILEENLTPGADGKHRTIAGLSLVDGSWQAKWRMIPMGMWLEVVPRDVPVDVRAWAARFADNVRPWHIESLSRTYPRTSWEQDQSIFYDYALGSLRGVQELAALLDSSVSPPAAVPALEIAERWGGANYLAYQADLLRSALADSLVPMNETQRERVARRSLALARESLAGDPRNVQALQVAAWVEGTSAFGSVTAEADLRHRIVAERPGDAAEFGAYLRAAALAARRAPDATASQLAHADSARAQLVATVDLAHKLCALESLARLRNYWAQPLTGLDDPRVPAAGK